MHAEAAIKNLLEAPVWQDNPRQSMPLFCVYSEHLITSSHPPAARSQPGLLCQCCAGSTCHQLSAAAVPAGVTPWPRHPHHPTPCPGQCRRHPWRLLSARCWLHCAATPSDQPAHTDTPDHLQGSEIRAATLLKALVAHHCGVFADAEAGSQSTSC